MRAPNDQYRRLDAAILGRIRQLADAEAAGADVTDIAEALIEALSPVSPFAIEALERAHRFANHYAPSNWAPEPVASASSLAGYVKRLLATRQGPTPPSPRVAPPGLRWLKILAWSGFVRESTFKAIDEPPPAPIFLAALLHGLNDHVAQVRAAANECFLRIGGRIAPDIVIAAAPYLVRRPREWRHAENSTVITALLSVPEVRAGIRELLTTGQDGWLPRFFRDVLFTDLADGWLEELASKAVHPAIRARSIMILADGRVDGLLAYEGRWRNPSWNRTRPVAVPFNAEALIATGARDRTVIVRKAAAQGLIRHYKTLPDVPALLAAFGDEKNNAIRERLDFIRRKLAAG